MTVTKERWRELCKLAARERDPEKFVKLCDEINLILQHAGDANLQSKKANSAKA